MTETSTHPGGYIAWDRFSQNWTTDFITGYQDAVNWMKTCPARIETDEIHDVHQKRREDPEANEATYYLDADKLSSFVAYCGEYVNVLDGPEYRDNMIATYGDSFKGWDPPKRMVAWPGAHAWFEGFGQAVAHVLDG